jgi:hypothetical protein
MPAPQYLATQLLCRIFRFNIEFAVQCLFTGSILPKRLGSIAELVIKPHETAMHALLERIDDQKPQSGLHCGLALSLPLLVLQELVQAVDGQSIEPPPLADQPFVEEDLIEIEAFKEFAPVEHAGTGQRGRIAATHCILELADIDDDPSIEAQHIAFCHDRHRLTVLAPFAKRR